MKLLGNRRGGAAHRCRDSHPTHERLVAAAYELLLDHRPEDISTGMILERSGVSRGSLYHHFEDLDDLLETALVRHFARTVDQNIAVMTELIEKAADSVDFYRATEQFTALTQDPDRRVNRFERVRLLGLASMNSRMSEKLAVEQNRLTRSYAELFRKAQDRGWMSDDFDPHVAAVLIQAYTVGKIVDDVSTDRIDTAEWNRTIMKIITRVFGASPG